jgi:hypothetical protein
VKGVLTLAAALSALAGTARAHHEATVDVGRRVPVATLAGRMAVRTPSFARQMKLSCAVCHLGGFPQLTRFGRLFKLNGYTLSGLPQIVEQLDSASRRSLELSPIPGLSLMAIVSATRVRKALPGTPAARSEYPQELSLFLGGEISPKLGTLIQVTYEDVSGKIGIDNSDLRFASHTRVGQQDVLYGVTLHNNPTVQDVWNTAPAWSYPFTSPGLTPHPSASTVVDGALAQSVLGLGGYALIGNVLYAEVSGYASAPQGPRTLVDSTQDNSTRGIAPYWRLALQNRTGPFYVMVGTFGLSAQIYPAGSSTTPNRYTDIGIDAQVEHERNNRLLVGRASFTHEQQSLAGSRASSPPTAANASNSLNSLRLSALFGFGATYSTSLAYFATTGSRDAVQYPAAPVEGSRSGSPRTTGEIVEFAVNPWLNTRLGLQYVLYQQFNGSATSYDVSAAGRNARDNDALYLYIWFAF